MRGGYDVLLAISLGVFVSLVAWAMVAARMAMRRRFDLIDIFLLAFGTIYGVGGAFIVYATEAGENPGGFRLIGHEGSFWIIPMLGLVCVLGSLALASVVTPSTPRPGDKPAISLEEDDWRPAAFWIGWAFLGVAAIASTFYTRAYGGFAGFLQVAAALRAGLFEEAGANPLSFLKPFGGFSIFSTFVFAATWLAAPAGDRMWSIAGFMASLVVSSATLYGWGGRVDLLVYWMTIVLGMLIYRYGVLPKLLGAASLLVVFLLAVMPPLTNAMNPGKSQATYGEFFAAELTFPFESSLHSLDLPSHRYGIDIAVAPVFVLPERIWSGFDIRQVSDLNSERLLGDRPREGFGYTIPADFVTFGLYQFGLPGPLVVALLWCLFLAWLDRLLVERLPRSLSAFLYAHAVFSIAALSTLYVDPKMQIARNFHYIFGLASVLLIPTLWRLLGAREPAYAT